MKIRLLIIILSLTITLIPLISACECRDIDDMDWERVTLEAEYVFVGLVTDIDNSENSQNTHFDVDSIIKGDIQDGKFVLEETGPPVCAVKYKIGSTYKVFVDGIENQHTSTCTTKPVTIIQWESSETGDIENTFQEPSPYQASHSITNPNIILYDGIILSVVLSGIIGCLIALFIIWRKRK